MNGNGRKRRLGANKKGFALVEALVALVIISIIFATASVVFLLSARVSNHSRDQMELTSVIRIVKENVAYAVRTSNPVPGTGISIQPPLGNSPSGDPRVVPVPDVIDLKGGAYPGYSFDVRDSASSYDANIKKLLVVLNKDGKQIRSFHVEVFKK